MKTALFAAATLAASSSALAVLTPSSADSVRDVAPPEPAFKADLRVRDARGIVRPELVAPSEQNGGPLIFEAPNLRNPARPTPRPWNSPHPKPITPQGDGEFPARHVVRDRDRRFPVPMPITKGNFVDPKMPMAMPDPAVDYKLHVREIPAEITTK